MGRHAIACLLALGWSRGGLAQEPHWPEMFPHWHARVAEFQADNAARAPGGVVFIGDSITEAFPLALVPVSPEAINRGIGGDHITGVTTRLPVSVFALQPRLVFVMIGVNDINSGDLSFLGMEWRYREMLERLREGAPDARVVLQSILPLRDILTINNGQVRDFNWRIEHLAEEFGMDHLDLHTLFCDKRGELQAEYTFDGIHLTRKGYRAWVRALVESGLLDERPTPPAAR